MGRVRLREGKPSGSAALLVKGGVRQSYCHDLLYQLLPLSLRHMTRTLYEVSSATSDEDLGPSRFDGGLGSLGGNSIHCF